MHPVQSQTFFFFFFFFCVRDSLFTATQTGFCRFLFLSTRIEPIQINLSHHMWFQRSVGTCIAPVSRTPRVYCSSGILFFCSSLVATQRGSCRCLFSSNVKNNVPFFFSFIYFLRERKEPAKSGLSPPSEWFHGSIAENIAPVS